MSNAGQSRDSVAKIKEDHQGNQNAKKTEMHEIQEIQEPKADGNKIDHTVMTLYH